MGIDNDSFMQICAALQRFVEERLIPAEEQVELDDDIAPEIVQDMREMGLFGLSIPTQYGGLGLSLSQEAQVMQITGRTSAAFRSVFGTNVGIGSQGIIMDGTEAQKAHYLPKLATGEIISSFALTEPDAGSDAAAIRTTARLDGSDYVLNGTKRYITNAPRAGLLTLMARSEPDQKGAAGISAFLVPTDLPGITIAPADRKMGQHGTKTSDIILEDVRVPAENVIGGVPGRGFKTAMKVLDRGRINIAATSVGMASRLIDEALAYAHERKAFGSAIADFQLVQAMLADSQTEYYAGRTMVTDAAEIYDREGKAIQEAACAKYFCTEMVGRVADRAVQIHGGAGYMAAYPVERFYRDVRLLRIYEGTSQIQQLIIARQMSRAFQQG
ncbi:acyl-CoA dehydrogenase [Roseobacter sp. HKCCD9010]|uniref:acyl-CoA dehydrogenase family protein n=1 Tax=Rhodobacterales TaxID=204455 RepID=UPI001491D700|nr:MULTISPECIES: acyl-CoA dehydrogenase family protein [Rhodobacterales]MBF9049253.1 acyl-CoA dehydrogenase [Rhodobacterales bacterium HKCCD4356]NNV11253.1 acyl-CoA dehydrogenase [Roseobacter sp. HKCCD7357]NNV15437.1 acyl-CoA dehydrogenase [Roseobacter sp. HKCCD8768]NNV24897.1 acyl-CoA dehydrogenase [Roseobacter sp. HKCCD8192]NNV29154.1 acyl-CoA dehydrogenase [Roseobacter sp. HKCCD9061]